MGGQVESHTDALLAGGQILTVERVGVFGRGKPCVLTNCPGPVGVHGGPYAPREGCQTGQRVDRLQRLEVLHRVQRLDGDALGRVPSEGGGHVTIHLCLFGGETLPLIQGGWFELIQHTTEATGALCTFQCQRCRGGAGVAHTGADLDPGSVR